MFNFIVRLATWALQQLLPGQGDHRAAPRRPHVICAPAAPIPAHLLARTILPQAEELPLVPRFLIAWEQRPEAEKQAERQRVAADAAERWEMIQRRATTFAVQLQLPDPLNWLDDATDAAGCLASPAA